MPAPIIEYKLNGTLNPGVPQTLNFGSGSNRYVVLITSARLAQTDGDQWWDFILDGVAMPVLRVLHGEFAGPDHMHLEMFAMPLPDTTTGLRSLLPVALKGQASGADTYFHVMIWDGIGQLTSLVDYTQAQDQIQQEVDQTFGPFEEMAAQAGDTAVGYVAFRYDRMIGAAVGLDHPLHQDEAIVAAGDGADVNIFFGLGEVTEDTESYAINMTYVNTDGSVSVRVLRKLGVYFMLRPASTIPVFSAPVTDWDGTIIFTKDSGPDFLSPPTHVQFPDGAEVPVTTSTTNSATLALDTSQYSAGGAYESFPVGAFTSLKLLTKTGATIDEESNDIGIVIQPPQFSDMLGASKSDVAGVADSLLNFIVGDALVGDRYIASHSVNPAGIANDLPGTPLTLEFRVFNNGTWSNIVAEDYDPAADADAPVFTTGIPDENIDEGDPAGTIGGHVVTDATLPITYTATLDGVAMPTGGWTVDATTGDISYPAGLAPGTYTYILTATDAATPTNSATSTGRLVVTADTTAPVFTTPAQNATIGAAGGMVSGHVVTDANMPILYSATVEGVAMPTAGWSIEPTTGEVTVPAGLAPGDYNYVITATDSSTGMNMGTSAGVVTVPDVSAPVFTTPVSSPTGNATAAGIIAGHVVTDASLPITYTATLNGVPMPTAGWSVDLNTGDITYPAGLVPGTYSFILTASDAATPANSSTSAGALTIPTAPVAALNHAIFPVSFIPEQNRSFVDLGALGPFALPGLPANEQVDYPNQDLEIFSDGSYSYTGAAPLTLDVEVSDGDGTWDAVSVTVNPLLDLAAPNWTPPTSTAVNAALSIDAADVFNSSIADPNAQVEFVGFPGASSATGNVLAVDTATAGEHAVAVRATINGHDYVTRYFDLVIAVAEMEADFAFAWSINQAPTDADFTPAWVIDARTLVDFTPSWLLDGREQVGFTPAWSIEARTLVDFTPQWLIDARTLVDTAAMWSLAQPPTDADFTHAWLIDAREIVDFTPTWALDSMFTEVDVTHTWKNTGTTFFNDASISWQLGVPPTQLDYTFSWLVHGPVELDFCAAWRILARSSFTQDRAFHILD